MKDPCFLIHDELSLQNLPCNFYFLIQIIVSCNVSNVDDPLLVEIKPNTCLKSSAKFFDFQMSIITIKTLMHMHIQTTCFNLIYHWILIYNGKKITLECNLQNNIDEL